MDVDAQPDIAAKYSITAMPTFLVIKEGKVVQTIRGANPPALKKAVGDVVVAAKVKLEREGKSKVEEKAKVEPKSEETVSGSYSVSKGEGWKTSLR